MGMSDSATIVNATFVIAVILAILGIVLFGVGLQGDRSEGTAPASTTRNRRLSLLGSLGTSLLVGAAFSLLVSMLGRQLDSIALAEEEARLANERRDQMLSTYLNALLFSSNLGGLDFAQLDQQLEDAGVNVGEFAESLAGGKSLDDCREIPSSTRKSQVLRGIKLAGKNLDYANFSGLELKDVDLRHASLREATFCKVTLDGVNLRGADLTGATFAEAEVINSDLQFAKFEGALVDPISNLEGSIANAETCWPRRWGGGFEVLATRGLEGVPLRNPYAPVKDPRIGHSCVEGEAEAYKQGHDLWFADQ